MKDIWILIKSNRNARVLIYFSLFLYCGMTASRTLQVLWFEENGSIGNFGLSYSAMAAAGAMSFFTGIFIRKLGLIFSLRVGCYIYSIGLALRIFTDSPLIAIVSGLIAGIGASTIFICIQPWIMSWVNDKDRPIAISMNHSISTLGNAMGNLIVALFMWILIRSLGTDLSFISIILFAAMLPIIASAFLPKSSKAELEEKKTNSLGVTQVLKKNLLLGIGVIFFGALGGLYSSIVTPYIPLILKDGGLSISDIGTVFTILTIIIAVINPFIGSVLKRKNKFLTLSLAEGVLCICTIILMLTISEAWVLIVILLFRAVALTVSIISEQTIQMGMFNGELASVYFGIAQTSFWIGDTIGASIGAWVYQAYGLKLLLLSATILILINAIFYPLFCLLFTKKIKNVVKANVSFSN